ncbi:hypothetical protein [Ornithinimicrobium cryptoxanthini]|uniref:hypothetical protein n=1 Tax=Ornithinimicrobium cryptoxanthini TaxID=2934161 RepID=UPI002117A771|nr:hypothetical protein [Ornithinimicrobium cryptoxanthini]
MTTPDDAESGADGDAPADDGGDDNGDEGPGLWDDTFAIWVAVIAVVFGLLLVVVLTAVGQNFTAVTATVHKVTEWVDGSFADQARFYLALVLIGVGSLLLLLAGCLASFEVRAKLKRPGTSETTVRTAGQTDGLIPIKDIVKVVTETIVKARGTAVVAIAGVAVIGLATLTASSIDDGPPAPAAKTGDSATSTAEPTDGEEEAEPTDDGSETDPPEPTDAPATGDE